MSGDVQTRQRRKEKKKQKRDEAAVPGIDTSKFNETEKKSVQMHIQEDGHHGDHGAGICAKIIFFTLMAILLGLVTLIVLENRGGSDVDTPLSESRFSEYLQGWVDENRQEDHHDEPHAADHDDEHDNLEESQHNEGHLEFPEDDQPYPEERDVSNNDNEPDDSQELNAEINNNESNQDDQEENDQNASQEDDNDIPDQNDDDQNDNEENNEQNDDANEANDDDDDDGPEENRNNEEIPSLFEDSAPFDEEGDDDEFESNKDIFENVVDNDAGEDILLQKLAEESELAQQERQQSDQDDQEEGSSSQIPEGGGAQNSYMEEFLRQQSLEENY